MLSLIISTIIYALVVWKVGPILDEHGVAKNMKKNILLALIAAILTIIPLMIIDYFQEPEILEPAVIDPNIALSIKPQKALTPQEKELQDAMKSLNEYSRLSK